MEKQKEVVSKVESPKEQVQERKRVFVDLDTSEEQVIAYEQAGAELFFTEKRFRVLADKTLADLSHDNRKRYYQTLQVIQKKVEDSKPKGRLEIIDPLAGGEQAMLRIIPKGKEGEEFLKRNHISWQRANELDAWVRKGYRAIRAGEDPIECGLKPAGTSFVISDPMGRKDLDLLMMCVDMVVFLQHESAVAAKSSDRVKRVAPDWDDKVKDMTRGKAMGMKIEEEAERVTIAKTGS
jgi:hypothetical protein